MNRFLAFLLASMLFSPALADMYPDASNAKLPDARTNLAIAPHVPTNAALTAASTVTYPSGVWRDDFAPGNGAPPLWYKPSGSACSLAAGNGDNGSQVKSADSKCWLSVPAFSIQNIQQYGAKGDCSTDDASSINAALTAAANTTRAVFLPQALGGCYLIKSPINVPVNMTGGVMNGSSQQAAEIRADPTFVGASMIIGAPALSLFAMTELQFNANNVAAITKALDFTRTPESSVQDQFRRVRVIGLANGATGIVLDGDEDTTLENVSIAYAATGHGVAVSWHVVGGNAIILNSWFYDRIKASFQLANIKNSTIGGFYCDGVCSVLNMDGIYGYADTDAAHQNIGTIGTDFIGTLSLTNSYLNPNGQNSVVVVGGKYSGNSFIENVALDPGANTGFRVFDATLTTAAPGALPTFTINGTQLLGSADIGLPASGVLVNNFSTSARAAGSILPLTSGTGAGLTQLTLSAGTWELWGACMFNGATTTGTDHLGCSIETTAGDVTASPTGYGAFTYPATTTIFSRAPAATVQIPANTERVTVAPHTTAIWNLNALAYFSVSTLGAYGRLNARRYGD